MSQALHLSRLHSTARINAFLCSFLNLDYGFLRNTDALNNVSL